VPAWEEREIRVPTNQERARKLLIVMSSGACPRPPAAASSLPGVEHQSRLE
jgi:hypothetical protein